MLPMMLGYDLEQNFSNNIFCPKSPKNLESKIFASDVEHLASGTTNFPPFQLIGKVPFSYKGASHLFFQLEKKRCKVPL